MSQTFLPDSDSEDELPPEWEERATNDGQVFYINHQTKLTQWTHPRTGKSKLVSGDLPLGWGKRLDSSGQFIYFNQKTNQETFTDPRLAFAIESSPKTVYDVRQRFDSSTTAFQVLHGKDLTGKLAVITGANSGIGFETARSLVFHNCNVIFACRNKDSAIEAINRIKIEKASANVECLFIELDLASLKSTKKFVDELKKDIKRIDILILNAGVFGLPYMETEDGFESTFQVNHLSHFYITQQLEGALDHNSRVIILSSESHRFANLSCDDLKEDILSPPKSKYSSMMAYNNSKLCNVLFARELGKRWQNRGISAFVLHPGNMVSSNLSRNWWVYRFLFALVRPFTKSMAASTTIYCAVATELTGLTGLYFNNCFFCEPSKLAQNDKLSEKLWEISENLLKRVIC